MPEFLDLHASTHSAHVRRQQALSNLMQMRGPMECTALPASKHPRGRVPADQKTGQAHSFVGSESILLALLHVLPDFTPTHTPHRLLPPNNKSLTSTAVKHRSIPFGKLFPPWTPASFRIQQATASSLRCRAEKKLWRTHCDQSEYHLNLEELLHPPVDLPTTSLNGQHTLSTLPCKRPGDQTTLFKA